MKNSGTFTNLPTEPTPNLGSVMGERRYNHERFSLVLAGRTPAEKLAAKLTLALPPSASPLSEVTA